MVEESTIMRKSDFTRKHFVALADALRESEPSEKVDAIDYMERHLQWQNDVDSIAVVCHKFSDLFDESWWRDYLENGTPKKEAA